MQRFLKAVMGDMTRVFATLAFTVVPLQAQSASLVDAELVQEVEGRARELVGDYYDRLLTADCVLYLARSLMEVENVEQGLLAPLCDPPAACRGLSLQDCMGGESLCFSLSTRCWIRASIPARQALLTELDLLGAKAPGSDWIIGQRVNLATKNGQLARAQATVEACAGTAWWCQALRGYVRHAWLQGAGEAVFDSALATAPPGTRAWAGPPDPERNDRGLHCEWRDVSRLLTGALLADYQKLPCGERGDFEERFWWLADPLWSAPENARRSEHLARSFALRLDGDVRPRGSDYHDWVMPAGPPNSWRFVPLPRFGNEPDRYLDRHQLYNYGGYSFTPDERRYFEAARSTVDQWALEWDEGHERMLTRDTWYNFDHYQSAILRRDGRLLAVAAARLPLIVPTLDSVRGALAMGRPADLHLEVFDAQVEPTGIVRARAELEDGEWMASFEIVGEDWVGRARHGTPAPRLTDGFGISDPLLVEERFEGGELTLLNGLLPTTDLTGRSRVGVYFEVYGVQAEELLRVSMWAERTDRSFLQRIAGALRLASASTLAVNWLEPAETAAPNMMQRYLTLDIGGWAEGEYRLEVRVERAGGASATTTRVVRVGRPSR